MSFQDWKTPKMWDIQSCDGGDLQGGDALELEGDAEGGTGNIYRHRGAEKVPWGSSCKYHEEQDCVEGTHTSHQTFTIYRTVVGGSASLSCGSSTEQVETGGEGGFFETLVDGIKSFFQAILELFSSLFEGPDSGPGPGSWTAMEGGGGGNARYPGGEPGEPQEGPALRATA